MEGKKSKAGKIIKGCLITLGGIGTLACAGYVIKEVKREYDETVDENNRLRDFINSHDFYNKEQTNLRSTDYESNDSDDNEEPEKFDRNNPVYKQSPRTMRKLGLNPDGTVKQKPQLVKIEECISEDGYVIEVLEDVPSGLKIYNPTNRKASDLDKSEEISYGNS